MIHKFVDFLCVTAGILVVLSLVQQVKKDFEDIKTSQAMQLVMLEKLVLMQNLETKQLKELKNETCRN